MDFEEIEVEVAEKENKKALCRVCLNYDCDNLAGGLSLFEKYNDIYVYEKMYYITSIEIAKDDNLPDMICSVCLVALDSACNFKQQCETADAFLHSSSQSCEALQAETEVPIKEEYLEEEYENDLIIVNSPLPLEEPQTDDNEIDGKEDNLVVDIKTQPFMSKAIDLKLECHDCSGIFKSKCKLKVHWKKVHLPLQLICPICKLTHKTSKAFRNHMKRRTKNCVNATKVRIEGEGKSRTFHCKECDASSKTIKTIIAHLVTHTGERPFACNICNRSFTQLSGLTRHKENVHKKYIKEANCESCGKYIQGRSKWFRHMKTHTKNQFSCSICSKVYSTKQGLKVHMYTHGSKSFTCEICAKTFYNSSGLYNHKVLVHLKNKYYTCEMCGYRSLKNSTISKHRPKHTQNNFACDICGRFFENKQQLALHKQRHLMRNFQCSLCEKRYYAKEYLLSHMRKIHNLYSPAGSKNKNAQRVKNEG